MNTTDETHTKKSDPKPSGKRYASVSDMLKGEQVSEGTVAAVTELNSATKFTRMLASLRVKSGLTQEQMGARMDPPRTQSAISKLESGHDEELTIADVRDYSKALNERIGLAFGAPYNHVEAIKLYATAMKERMLALAKLAHDDQGLEQGVQAFFGEAFFNILGLLSSCHDIMPKNKEFEIKITVCHNSPKIVRLASDSHTAIPV